jgi:hypothetical protein
MYWLYILNRRGCLTTAIFFNRKERGTQRDDYNLNKPALYNIFTGLLSQNNSKSSKPAAA